MSWNSTDTTDKKSKPPHDGCFFEVLGLVFLIGAVVAFGKDAYAFLVDGVWTSTRIVDLYPAAYGHLPDDYKGVARIMTWFFTLPLSALSFCIGLFFVWIGLHERDRYF